MKPLKLAIEGFKSVAERQTVDFERLARGGIFGIFGKTGSGKSTVLNAIVLAVYGEVIENLKSAEFINTRRDFACVELIFSVKRGGAVERYEVARKYKFNKARTLVTQTASLIKLGEEGEKSGEGVCLAETPQTVTALLKNDIIGLEKSDFLKCMALPQGEFAAFVKMTRGERLSVIGKLFDLTKYGEELAAKTKSRQLNLDMESERLTGKLEALDCPPKDVIEADEAELSALSETIYNAQAELSVLEADLAQAKQLKLVLSEASAKSDELKEKCRYKPVIEQKRKKLNEFSNAKSVKAALELYDARMREQSEGELLKNELLKKRAALEKLLLEASAKKQQAAALSEKTIELKLRLKQIDDLKAKNEQLIEKKAYRSKLLQQFSALNEQAAQESVKKQEYEKKAALLKAELEKIDTDGVLAQLKAAVAASAVGELAYEEISFLTELNAAEHAYINRLTKDIHSPEKSAESAVNGLISARIEQLKQKLGDKKGNAAELITAASSALKKNTEITGELEKTLASAKQAELSLSDIAEKRESIKQEGVKVRAECDELDAQIKNVLGGLSYENAAPSINGELEKINEVVRSANEFYENAYSEKTKNDGELFATESRLKSLKNQIEQTKIELNAALLSAGVTVEQARAALDYPDAAADEKMVNAYDTSVKILEAALGELNKKALLFSEKHRDYEKIADLYAEKREKISELNKKHSELCVKHKNDLKNSAERCIITEKVGELSKKRDLLGRLLELVRAGRLMEFIADEYLKEIAYDAESRVLELTGGRYGLVYDGNFFVIDNYGGGVKRPVAGLSGGETFIVSLSLALSLSKQIGAKALRPIDFFFLDEGFGTLDEDLIDAVTASLEKLRSANFTVGLITHVAELKNRIPCKLCVHGATAFRGTVIESVY